MPGVNVNCVDAAVAIVGCVSKILGFAALAVLLTLQPLLLSNALCFLTGGCLAVSIVSHVVLMFVKSRIIAIAVSILLLVCCIASGVVAIREIQQDTSEYFCGYYYDPCLNIGTPITAASGTAFGFTILELVIALFVLRKQSVNAQISKSESLGWLEENGPAHDQGYERHHSPERGHTADTWQRSHTEGRGRPRSKAGLWNDDAITTARIPKEKIKVGELITQGGYGEVYKGFFNGLAVAIKMMLPANRKSVTHVNKFLAEVKLMASLDHPCIVQFVGVAWHSLSDVCAVTEFMEGGDLRGLLTPYDNDRHPVGFDYDKVNIALHVAHALTYLHSLEPVVIHRDLKSRNILLTVDLSAKLIDFGVSRERADHTMTAGVGTSLWMAPEVLMGERYDDKADIFSFGVMLSELDLQVLPYSHATESTGSGHRMRDLAILQRMAMGKLRVQFSEGATASVVTLGEMCVSLDSKDRPSAAEVLYKLQVIQRELCTSL
ncbi:hypothetical protein ON010_g6732 [Phytophthora cinnamomi]|nr:hypothetical protein ON010_g6732 [Phytophthora cinnamomi]